MLKAVDFVSSSLLANPNHTWSIGPLGHALHSLVIFHQRLYKEPTFAPKSELAAEPLRTKVRTTGTDLMPPEPECEARIDMTIEQLQRAAAKAARDARRSYGSIGKNRCPIRWLRRCHSTEACCRRCHEDRDETQRGSRRADER